MPPSSASNSDDVVLCPSAQPDTAGSRILGVVNGTVEQPRMIHLTEPPPVSPALLALATPVSPTEVWRFTAPCAANGCQHFDGSSCRLVHRIVEMRDEVTERLPICGIRPQCRWWRQEGRAACQRCPGIVTEVIFPDEKAYRLATPERSSAGK